MCLQEIAGGLCDCDVGEALHGFVQSRLLLIVDESDASIKHIGIALDLLHDVEQPPGHFVVSLHVVHSHVVNVLVGWCDDLDDAVEEGITNQGDDSGQIAVVVTENDLVIRLDQIAQVAVDVRGLLVVFRHR